MTSTEEDHTKTMDGWMTNMSKLTDAITAGFGLLQQALCSQQPTPTKGSLLGHFQSGSALPMQAHWQGMQPGFTPNFNYPGYSSTGASSLWQNLDMTQALDCVKLTARAFAQVLACFGASNMIYLVFFSCIQCE